MRLTEGEPKVRVPETRLRCLRARHLRTHTNNVADVQRRSWKSAPSQPSARQAGNQRCRHQLGKSNGSPPGVQKYKRPSPSRSILVGRDSQREYVLAAGSRARGDRGPNRACVAVTNSILYIDRLDWRPTSIGSKISKLIDLSEHVYPASFNSTRTDCRVRVERNRTRLGVRSREDPTSWLN